MSAIVTIGLRIRNITNCTLINGGVGGVPKSSVR